MLGGRCRKTIPAKKYCLHNQIHSVEALAVSVTKAAQALRAARAACAAATAAAAAAMWAAAESGEARIPDQFLQKLKVPEEVSS